MNQGQQIRCYDYVNHPYAQVRDALVKDPLTVFQTATRSASSRANQVASELRVELGAIAINADIVITVHRTEETGNGLGLAIEWEAANAPRLFPVMRADLNVYPLTSTETQLDLHGVYDPPLGVLGIALDSIAGHRIAEASVHRFLTDVADYLRRTLSSASAES
jgi:hypothetical protein